MLNMAQGSLEELRYFFILALDLGYIKQDSERDAIEEIVRMLGAYAQSLLTPPSCLLPPDS